MTWSRGAEELILCFNRDEQHTRSQSIPPAVWGEGFIAPRDVDAGGSWMAAKPDGTVLALLNHYPPGQPRTAHAKSRGRLVTMLAALDPWPTPALLRQFGVAQMNPFRLVALSRSKAVLFTWNGRQISRETLRGDCGFITSSSWNSAAVRAVRHILYRQWRETAPSGDLAAMVEFHSVATHPKGQAWAICMSREDARSVSLNMIRVTDAQVEMTQQDRPRGSEGFSPDTHRATISR